MNKKILYITHKNDFWGTTRTFLREEHNRIIKDDRYIVCDLINKYNENIIITHKPYALCATWHTIKNEYQRKYANNIFYKSFNLYNNRFLMLHDIHNYTFGSFNNLVNNIKKYNNVISLYDNYELDKIKELCGNSVKFHILPHHTETDIFKDHKLEKIYDVTLYGACRQTPYPFRHRLLNLLRSYKNKSPIKINIIPDIPWIGRCAKYTGLGLAKILNQSYIAIATKSKYDYLLKKYFEISACKALLVGDMPESGKNIWNDNYVNINNKMTNKEILDILVNTVDKLHKNDNELNKKINTMYDIMQKNYSLSKYYDKLYNIITKN